MKYVSLDLETSGLDHADSSVLSLAMVIEDSTENKPLTDLPSLKLLFLDQVYGLTDTAVAMNSHLFAARALVANPKSRYLFTDEQLRKADEILSNYTVIQGWWDNKDAPGAITVISEFLEKHFGNHKVTLAGKNVASFDYNFLPTDLQSKFNHRMLDPGSMFVKATDKVVPNTAECCRRAGVEDTVTHDAYGDALQVIQLIRKYFSQVV